MVILEASCAAVRSIGASSSDEETAIIKVKHRAEGLVWCAKRDVGEVVWPAEPGARFDLELCRVSGHSVEGVVIDCSYEDLCVFSTNVQTFGIVIYCNRAISWLSACLV